MTLIDTKEAFKSLKPPVKQVDIPDTDVSVYIRMFTVGQRQQVMDYCQQDETLGNLLAILTLSLCDKDGNLIFLPEEKDALEMLSMQAATELVQEVLNFNRMTTDAQEDLVKNSEAATSGETSSPSVES